MAVSQQENIYYDLAAIKEIPILSVADLMGISVQKKGRNHWCKVRQEEVPSVILHEDRNTFYDFGNQVHGDVISFVQYAKDMTPGEAIRFLGESFSIAPSMSRQELLHRPLTNWEYSRIGLYGDLASKNITFPIDKLTLSELCEMSQYYQMPMNKLKKVEPGVYRSLILKKAVPHVEALRNSYYLDVWNYFHLCYAMGDNSIDLFRSQKVRKRFEKDTAALNRSEKILYRACKNAGMDVKEPGRHDPVSVIRKLLHGDLAINLGNISEKDLTVQAKRLGCSVSKVRIPLYAYFDDRLLSFGHAAHYLGGRVTVQYLSFHEKELAPILKELQEIPDRVLEQRIAQHVDDDIVPQAPKKEIQKNFEIY